MRSISNNFSFSQNWTCDVQNIILYWRIPKKFFKLPSEIMNSWTFSSGNSDALNFLGFCGEKFGFLAIKTMFHHQSATLQNKLFLRFRVSSTFFFRVNLVFLSTFTVVFFLLSREFSKRNLDLKAKKKKVGVMLQNFFSFCSFVLCNFQNWEVFSLSMISFEQVLKENLEVLGW